MIGQENSLSLIKIWNLSKVNNILILVKGDTSILKAESEESIEDEIIPTNNNGINSSEIENADKQVEQFNKSLKEEKMMERLERIMNEFPIKLTSESKLIDHLNKKEYFVLFCGMISKPHQYQSITAVAFL